MRTTGKQVFRTMTLPTTIFLGALLALTLLLLLPGNAAAQSDAARIMSAIDNARFPAGSRTGRDDGIWRDDDRRRDDGRYENRRADNRRDAQRLRKEQQAREKFCRKNPRERVCRAGYGYGLENRRNNDAAWCWDRNRDSRCDVNQANRRPPGRRVAWGRR